MNFFNSSPLIKNFQIIESRDFYLVKFGAKLGFEIPILQLYRNFNNVVDQNKNKDFFKKI